jgi:uncharacterized membrane protein
LEDSMADKENDTVHKPALGAVLAIAAGFSFYVLCMILPLVGPAGSRVPHAAKNKTTFMMVLAITLVLAAASTFVALQRRKQEGGRLPYFSIGMGVLCILFFIMTLFNGFAV